MRPFIVGAAGVLGAIVLAIPMISFAQIPLLNSFGGRVATIAPCFSALGPSLHVTVVPFGGVPAVAYIWTPLTITYSYGPPTHPAQQVLGLSDVPYVCFTPTTPPLPLYGLRMFSVGTSVL
jgi:hypothetical protein